MTTRLETQPHAAARILLRLALPVLFLAGCVSAPVSPPPVSTPVAVVEPPPVASVVTPPVEAAPAVASAPDSVAAPVPVDPLRPGVHLQLDDRTARVDLWERVRRGFAIPDLDSELVHERERWYASRPEYVARMTERGGRYLFHIVEELDKRGMPTELALLPFIESAYNP
ncbi:MAG: lytic transglycosylase, partial [Caldimonas sp.]